MNDPKIYKTSEVAKMFRLSRKGVYSLIKQGLLRRISMGNKFVFTKQAIDDFISNQEES